MKLDNFLVLLGKEVGQEFSIQDGSCTLQFDDMKVTLQENDATGQVMLYGIVGVLPPFQREKLYAALLMGNHLFEGTTGATLSLNQETEEICLCKVIDGARTPYESMRRLLEQFVGTLENWKNVLVAYRPEEAPDTPEENSFSGTMMRV